MTADAGFVPSGRMVAAVLAGESYEAFVPDPLPPGLVLDAALVGRLSAADRAIGELAGLGCQSSPHR